MNPEPQKVVNIIDAPGYQRELSTGAVILTTRESTDKYLLERKKKLDEIRKMNDLQREVESLRCAIDELRECVKDLKLK